jgi:hypothetical protein
VTSGWRSTGSSAADSRDDFSRARRRAQLAKIAALLRGRPDELTLMLPFDEVVAALGRRGERYLGLQDIDLDTIVGSVDRRRGFDRRFRPTSGLARERFERLAAAVRRGESLPPIDVYRVGEAHFVRDGHHRVAVARAFGWRMISAYVTEVLTEVGATRDLTIGDLPLKGHERLFWERVPLPPPARHAIVLSDPWDYAVLAEAVEAWGFRYLQARGELLTREEVARAWLREEFIPTIRLLREEGLAGEGTDAEVYMRLSAERYRLLRTHRWDESALAALRHEHRR